MDFFIHRSHQKAVESAQDTKGIVEDNDKRQTCLLFHVSTDFRLFDCPVTSHFALKYWVQDLESGSKSRRWGSGTKREIQARQKNQDNWKGFQCPGLVDMDPSLILMSEWAELASRDWVGKMFLPRERAHPAYLLQPKCQDGIWSQREPRVSFTPLRRKFRKHTSSSSSITEENSKTQDSTSQTWIYTQLCHSMAVWV